MTHETDKRSSLKTATLLLRFRRPGLTAEEEHVVVPGLTIGRTRGSSIVLEGDESVDRLHARVHVGYDGALVLRLEREDLSLRANGTDVREVLLSPDAVFSIGRTRFECVAGAAQAPSRGPARDGACPRCGSPMPQPTESLASCASCGCELLAVPSSRPGTTTLVPRTYGAWRAQRFVARGGMGLVLRGSHVSTGMPVAIKLIDSGAEVTEARFDQEIRLLASVEHPNLVALLDHGRSEGCRYLVMEWIDGRTLQDVIMKRRYAEGHIEFTKCWEWLCDICHGLAALHARGIVHRDIKPSNILIDSGGRARIADLGIARLHGDATQGHTVTGQTPGTPFFMAPEQIYAPDSVDCRADLYSLGCVAYQLLTGRLPVGECDPVSSINRSVPWSVDALVQRLRRADPSQRPQNVSEVCDTLASLLPRVEEGPSVQASPPRPPIATHQATDAPREVSAEEPIVEATQAENDGDVAFILGMIALLLCAPILLILLIPLFVAPFFYFPKLSTAAFVTAAIWAYRRYRHRFGLPHAAKAVDAARTEHADPVSGAGSQPGSALAENKDATACTREETELVANATDRIVFMVAFAVYCIVSSIVSFIGARYFSIVPTSRPGPGCRSHRRRLLVKTTAERSKSSMRRSLQNPIPTMRSF